MNEANKTQGKVLDFKNAFKPRKFLWVNPLKMICPALFKVIFKKIIFMVVSDGN